MITLGVVPYRLGSHGTKGVISLKILHYVAFALLVVGGLNWGLVGLLNLNLVDKIFGTVGLTNIVYILVGVSAVYIAATHMGDCKSCGK